MPVRTSARPSDHTTQSKSPLQRLRGPQPGGLLYRRTTASLLPRLGAKPLTLSGVEAALGEPHYSGSWSRGPRQSASA
jgi:hypothetical protein